MTISFSIPVKDHYLYDKMGKYKFYPNIGVVNTRSAKFHNSEYPIMKNTPVVAIHNYENGMIFYYTDLNRSSSCFTFDVSKIILPYVSVHVYKFNDGRLWLDGPVEIHFCGPEDIGLLLKLEY